MLLIGLFLPMVSGPMGTSLSFVDVPWTMATSGLFDSRGRADRDDFENEDRGRRDKRSKADGVVYLAVALAVLYPLGILVLIFLAFLRIVSGTNPRTLAVLGGSSLAATFFLGLVLFALASHEEFRVVRIFASPGFGWAVLTIGGLTLTASGIIKPESRDRD